MIRLVGIGGEPGTGKSTLVRLIRLTLGQFDYHRSHGVDYERFYQSRVLVLGEYDTREFSGTDTMSMSVQPSVLKALHSWSTKPDLDGMSVIFEGDRLFNPSFIASVTANTSIESRFYVLTVSPDTAAKRRAARVAKQLSSQSDAWTQSRRTKIKNIIDAFPAIRKRPCESDFDRIDIAGEILGFVLRKPKQQEVLP